MIVKQFSRARFLTKSVQFPGTIPASLTLPRLGRSVPPPSAQRGGIHRGGLRENENVARGCIGVRVQRAAMADNTRVYKEGSVTTDTYVKIKDGQFDNYMKWLDTTFKPENEALIKAKIIIG